MTGLELAAQIACARLTGAKNGSCEIDYFPGQIQLPNHYHADSVTAGSITLLIQVALPLLLFSPTPVPASTLTLLGGTNATMAPQVDYTKNVFLPFISKHFGVDGVSLHIKKRGYYPKGGGEVELSVTPLSGDRKLRGFSLMNQGKVNWIAGISHCAGLPASVANEMVDGATARLARAGFLGGKYSNHVDVTPEVLEERRTVQISIQSQREPNNLTRGAGSGIVLWAQLDGGGIIGGSAVGMKGMDPAAVGDEAATQLIKGIDAGGCVDEVKDTFFYAYLNPIHFYLQWTQDQIIIFMALAEGKSEVRCGSAGLSLHTRCSRGFKAALLGRTDKEIRTAIWLAEELTDATFEIEEEPAGTVVIRCQGVGHTAGTKEDNMATDGNPSNNVEI